MAKPGKPEVKMSDGVRMMRWQMMIHSLDKKNALLGYILMDISSKKVNFTKLNAIT